MTKYTKWSLIVLRISMGWVMLYAGLAKIFDPEWTAAGYLLNAKTFPGFFESLAQPEWLSFVSFVNEWGLTLLGVSLILGVFVRLSSILGAVLMLLYYFPILEWPMAGPHGYIIDDHIIYALILVLFAAIGAGRYFGFDKKFRKTSYCQKHPKCCRWLA